MNSNAWKTKEVVVAAMIAVAVGLFNMLLDLVYMPLFSLLGPIFKELTFGIYSLSVLMPAYIFQKRGLALFGGVVTALVNILAGSSFGLQIMIAAVLKGVSMEAAVMLRKNYKDSTVMLAGVIMSILVYIRDYFVFGYAAFGLGTNAAMLALRLVSAIFIGTYFSKSVAFGLAKTGVLNSFSICNKDTEAA